MNCAMGVCLLLALPAPSGPEPTPTPTPVRVYTNADLERLRDSPHRTGATSRPATRAVHAPAPEREDRSREEARWRRDAQKLRDRLERVEDEMDELRERIRARRAEPGVRPYSDPKIRSWEERLRQLEGRVRERWARFRERARRARVPPGWLR